MKNIYESESKELYIEEAHLVGMMMKEQNLEIATKTNLEYT